MTNINNYGKIEITRGDSFKSPLFLNQGNKMSPIRYELKSQDTLYFALMEPNQSFENAILKQKYTKDSEKTDAQDIYIKISCEETENLLPGQYYYTIKLRSQEPDGTYFVQTVVPQSEFYIMR